MLKPENVIEILSKLALSLSLSHFFFLPGVCVGVFVLHRSLTPAFSYKIFRIILSKEQNSYSRQKISLPLFLPLSLPLSLSLSEPFDRHFDNVVMFLSKQFSTFFRFLFLYLPPPPLTSFCSPSSLFPPPSFFRPLVFFFKKKVEKQEKNTVVNVSEPG